MLNSPIPIACVKVAAPGIGEDFVSFGFGQYVFVGGFAGDALVVIDEAGGGLVDFYAVLGVEGAGAFVDAVGRTDRDAAALVIESTGGGVEGFVPDFGIDFEGEGTADGFDADAVFARLVEGGKVEGVDIALGVVAVFCVFGVLVMAGEFGFALEDGFGAFGLIGDEPEFHAFAVGNAAAVAHPCGEECHFRQIIRTKTRMSNLYGFAALLVGLVAKG